MNENEMPVGAMERGDWRDAVEVEPELIPHRQIRGSHWFDLTKTPAEIRWNVEDLSVDDRKQMLFSAIEQKYRQELMEIAANATNTIESTQAFLKVMLDKQTEKDAIDKFTTHDQIDAHMIENNLL